MTDIRDIAALRRVYEPASELALKKEMDHVDRHAREFIAVSPFVVLSTADADGWPDASPRGDAPGFVTVADDKHLHLPDRPGNNRLDTLENILRNPRVGMLFLVPGRLETLRVNGTARIRTDADLCAAHAVRGRPARAIVEIETASVYFQCGKAVVRSGLWQKDRWPSIAGLATFAEALTDQVKSVDKAVVEQRLETSYRDTLY
jgi:PPOX class probable FMN-dependent enzyme